MVNPPPPTRRLRGLQVYGSQFLFRLHAEGMPGMPLNIALHVCMGTSAEVELIAPTGANPPFGVLRFHMLYLSTTC